MNLNDLATFVKVAEAGSFAGAARALGVPKSTVSRRVSRLEGELEVALLRRSGRSFELTAEGTRLHERSQPALREISLVTRDLEGTVPEGRLRLTAPIDLGVSAWLTEVLAGFRETVPTVEVDLMLTNRSVDLLEDGIDLALRLHMESLPPRDDLVARVLYRGKLGLYASPAHLERHGTPARLADADTTLGHAHAWRDLWPRRPNIVADDFAPLVGLAVSGAGIASLPDYLGEHEVGQQRLVRLALPDGPDASYRMSLVWLRTRHLAGRVRAFVDYVTAHPPCGG